jgi:hypothetical protein
VRRLVEETESHVIIGLLLLLLLLLSGSGVTTGSGGGGGGSTSTTGGNGGELAGALGDQLFKIISAMFSALGGGFD